MSKEVILGKNLRTYLQQPAEAETNRGPSCAPLAGAHDNSMDAKSKQEQDEKSEQKRQAATKKEEKIKLQECMGREIDERKHTLEAYRQMQDVD